jgi:hypothetical protein
VRRILKSAAWTIEEIAKDFSRHANDIDTLEATMAGKYRIFTSTNTPRPTNVPFSFVLIL